MGALTNKISAFVPRGWDLDKLKGVDPTDGFGADTKIYIKRNKIILIEPNHYNEALSNWLTDKGRQFFDGVFGSRYFVKKTKRETPVTKKSWLCIVETALKTVFIFDHCCRQKIKSTFFIVVFENLSLEVLGLLTAVSQQYSFIKLKQSETSSTLENDLEKGFQLNATDNKTTLNLSTLCLLVSNNSRYEGSNLNLNLRRRFLKGNFKCLSIGSSLNLAFLIHFSFLGTGAKIVRFLAEGASLMCVELRQANNPIVIYNNELFKRHDGDNFSQMLKLSSHLATLSGTWDGLNMLNSSLQENGKNFINKYDPVSANDLKNSSLLYFINVQSNNNPNLKKITELNLLNCHFFVGKRVMLDQNYKSSSNVKLYNKVSLSKSEALNRYLHLPSSNFYENNETFLNTEGYVKRTTKLVSQKKARNNWQIVKKLFAQLKDDLISSIKRDNELVFFCLDEKDNFKNYMHFNSYATQILNQFNFVLALKNKALKSTKTLNSFKITIKKLYNTRLKYWLDDFFTDSKDEYSQNSLVLTSYSRVLRTESATFF